jgi:predicted small metal-binding protein
MLEVSCNDIGMLGCDFVAQGEKLHKVEGRMIKHIRETHPQLIAGLDFEQHRELERRITAQVHVPQGEAEAKKSRRLLRW